MAFVQYHLRDKRGIGLYDSEAEAHADAAPMPGEYTVIEYDWQENDYLPSMRLSDDGLTLSNRFPGKTIPEQIALIEAEDDARRLEVERAFKRERINSTASDLIREIAWKRTKARDTDLINGNSDAMTAYLNEKNSIRVKSNEAQAAMEAITDIDELRAFQYKQYFN